MGKREKLTILEAVDHLSSLAELDSTPSEKKAEWLDAEHVEENRETVKSTFRVLRNYLEHVYQAGRPEPETQRGVQAMMLLAGEAAQKLDKYTSLFRGVHEKESVTGTKEYQDLQQFYLTKIQKRFQQALEKEESWQAEWGEDKSTLFDIERRGLKDLEVVRRDREYELFYIRKEDGSPFFHKNLLRHVRLLGDFDESLGAEIGEDPFLKIKLMQDRDLHVSAREILDAEAHLIDEFYKEALAHKTQGCVASLSKALMALMLSANPRHLLSNTSNKNSCQYFQDFHYFLREALKSQEYRHFNTLPLDDQDPFSRVVLTLVRELCCCFFMRRGESIDAMQWIKHFVAKKEKNQVSLSFWSTLLDEDEEIRAVLQRYPNGPLLKTLDALRGAEHGFDPLAQENYPSQLYTFQDEKSHVTVLRIPSPTHQKVIQNAEIVDEFRGFISCLALKRQKHLLINLQDRTSWQEHARSHCLEKAEIEGLVVLTLPKFTDFYLQTAEYLDEGNAHVFTSQFKEQIVSGESCGYELPSFLKTVELKEFIDKAMETIHQYCFNSKAQLSRKQRLDFIEIFYLLFILKCVEWINPDSLSFTCKDAIDTGAAASSSLFAFLKLCADSPVTSEERELLLWMLYAPALTIRERAINLQTLNRFVSCLSHLDASLKQERTKILKAFNALYRRPLLPNLRLSL